MSLSRLQNQRFTSSGSWTCPAGVTQIIVWGMSGGAGGRAGRNSSGSAAQGGAGGCAAALIPVVLDVIPNTTYTITIGAGGAGGTSGTSGDDGGDTSFGALMTWEGITANSSSSFGVYMTNSAYSTDANYEYDYPRGGGLGFPADTTTADRGYPGAIGVSAAVGTSGS